MAARVVDDDLFGSPQFGGEEEASFVFAWLSEEKWREGRGALRRIGEEQWRRRW